jgi:hypothetical protein
VFKETKIDLKHVGYTFDQEMGEKLCILSLESLVDEKVQKRSFLLCQVQNDVLRKILILAALI